MSEIDFMRDAMVEGSRLGARLFRHNVAQAWVGHKIAQHGNTITLANPRVLHAGLVKGGSDLIGWTVVEVTPEMVGTKVAVFTGVETKALRGNLSPEQRTFIRNVEEAGGYAGMARTLEDVHKILRRG